MRGVVSNNFLRLEVEETLPLGVGTSIDHSRDARIVYLLSLVYGIVCLVGEGRIGPPSNSECFVARGMRGIVQQHNDIHENRCNHYEVLCAHSKNV